MSGRSGMSSRKTGSDLPDMNRGIVLLGMGRHQWDLDRTGRSEKEVDGDIAVVDIGTVDVLGVSRNADEVDDDLVLVDMHTSDGPGPVCNGRVIKIQCHSSVRDVNLCELRAFGGVLLRPVLANNLLLVACIVHGTEYVAAVGVSSS